jgi:hypothetical protein
MNFLVIKTICFNFFVEENFMQEITLQNLIEIIVIILFV